MIKKVIFSVLLFFLAVIVLFVSVEIGKNNLLSIIRYNKLQNKIMGDDNILVFRVTYLGLFPAGEARLENIGEELYQGKKAYHLSAQAYPLDFLSSVFNVQAQVDSYIDAGKLHTLKFMQRLSLPGKPQEEKEVLYDQDKNYMELKGVRRQILPNTQDPLSAIFYIRHQNFELGKVFDLNINTNQKNYQLYAKVTERKEYFLRSEKVMVWVLEAIIRRRDKNPYHKTTMKLWLVDDSLRTPILIKAMTNIGHITARLTSIE